MEGPYRDEAGRPVGPLRCLYCGTGRAAAGDACRGCGAEPPSVPCEACGRPVAAPLGACVCGTPCRVWGETPPDGLPCPRCGGALWRVQLDVSAVHVEQCSRCLGCFARTLDFSELVAREEAGESVTLRRFVPVAAGRELPRQTLLASVRCPHCRREMDRARFARRASIIVDVCNTHGIWLDAGELVQVLDFVKQRAVGQVPPDEVEREEEITWNRVQSLHALEERIVDLHTARAERLMEREGLGAGTLAKALAATAFGGPWLGLFVVLRSSRTRRP